MKAHLMYHDRDFEKEPRFGAHERTLTLDLELNLLFDAMANSDTFILEAVKKAMFNSLREPEEILYRQAALKDCFSNPEAVRELYTIVSSGIERKKKNWMGVTGRYLSSILSGSVNLLQMFTELMRELRRVADGQGGKFTSKAFTELFLALKEQLDDDYLNAVEGRLKELKFRGGMLVSVRIGRNGLGSSYVLRREPSGKPRFLKWNFAPGFAVNPRDNSECADLSRRKDRAINRTANSLAQSADHVLAFFVMLQEELAFYVGCLNLHDALTAKGGSVGFPQPRRMNERGFTVRGLYDASLALLVGEGVVGNDIDADGKDFLIITGANQGGKSTFLRSAGQAQLMMQCGMFVAATEFRVNICDGLYTHFKKEEESLKSGKLNEELLRMSEIVDEIHPNALILFNESFATTNEREGSEIGRQIVRALLDRGIKVYFVSHFYDFAQGFYARNLKNTLFLRADRREDGQRTFRLIEGAPLRTSFGEDIYKKIILDGYMPPTNA